MKKLNKFHLKLGSTLVSLLPFTTVVGCSLERGSYSTFNGNIVDKNGYTQFISDGGSIDDKSFNESSVMGVKIFSQKSNTTYSQWTPKNATFLGSAYDKVFEQNFHNLVIAGFIHSEYNIERRWSEKFGNNTEKHLIWLDHNDNNDNNNIIGITFNKSQAGFLAGIRAGFIANKLNNNNPKVGVIGGMPFPAVLDYMNGFCSGITYFNNFALNKNKILKKVVFVSAYSDLKKDFTGTFEPDGSGKVNTNRLIDKGTNVIMSVNAGQIKDVISAIKSAHEENSVKVIGVDTDQYKTYGNIVAGSAVVGTDTAINELLLEDYYGNYLHDREYSLSDGSRFISYVSHFQDDAPNKFISDAIENVKENPSLTSTTLTYINS
ncbi:MAG: BMP family ABC transporter substrate-binding protein [Mollicutes bacterium PWAP]|nr:BMP family ABC transporter substrate-binding protein [Mollicutes bacterium PWAP]